MTIEDPDAPGEQRFVAVGLRSAGKLLVLAYSVREDAYRLISA